MVADDGLRWKWQSGHRMALGEEEPALDVRGKRSSAGWSGSVDGCVGSVALYDEHVECHSLSN